jgi:uncharacterized repeat protein (TIGR03803 family)
MRRKTVFILGVTLAILATTVLSTSAWAVREKLLHNFNGKNGASPKGLIFDASGNLYGTTYYGGTGLCWDGYGLGCGTVFELTPKSGGGWSEKVLHDFTNNNNQDGGVYPSDGVIFDASGNLYGTTGHGGVHTYGTVFELMPKTGGGWTEKVLYSFKADKDGWWPSAGMVFDSSGNLYGTTYYGGGISCSDGRGRGCGTVFELTPASGGGWTEKILHRFNGNYSEGVGPRASLIFDSSGNLYGTTSNGGTVFELTPKLGGEWGLKVLHTFGRNGKDGNNPAGSLIFDASGNLYGTTSDGPPQGYNGPCYDGTDLGCGVVFELTPKVAGGWTEKILHYFKSDGKDGYHPSTNLIFDSSGNLYSTTSRGGPNDNGTVFEMTRDGDGNWMESVLHSFDYKNGFGPDALIFDASGNLFGTTWGGGSGNCSMRGGCGTVFELIP